MHKLDYRVRKKIGGGKEEDGKGKQWEDRTYNFNYIGM